MSANLYPPIPDGPEPGPDRAFMRRNQELIAKRTRWPEGALAACWKLEDAHPGWHVAWFSENTFKGFERPACYRALYSGGIHEVEVFAPTPEELEPLMQVPDHDWSYKGCAWCIAEAETRARRAGLRRPS